MNKLVVICLAMTSSSSSLDGLAASRLTRRASPGQAIGESLGKTSFVPNGPMASHLIKTTFTPYGLVASRLTNSRKFSLEMNNSCNHKKFMLDESLVAGFKRTP